MKWPLIGFTRCIHTHHLSANTESQSHDQSPLFGTGPVQGVLSQNQSRQHIQPLLTVLLIRDHAFLKEDKNQSLEYLLCGACVWVTAMHLYLSSSDGGQSLRLQLLCDVRHRICYNHWAPVERVLHSLWTTNTEINTAHFTHYLVNTVSVLTKVVDLWWTLPSELELVHTTL